MNFFFFIFYNFRSRHLKVDCMGSSNHHHSQLISLRKNDDWCASMCGELLMGSLGVRAFNTISFLRLLRLHHRHHYQHYQYSMSKMGQRQFVIVNCYISLSIGLPTYTKVRVSDDGRLRVTIAHVLCRPLPSGRHSIRSGSFAQLIIPYCRIFFAAVTGQPPLVVPFIVVKYKGAQLKEKSLCFLIPLSLPGNLKFPTDTI